MAKEEFFEEESSQKKKTKEVSGKTKKPAQGKKTTAKAGTTSQASKAKEASATKLVAAATEEGTDEKLMLDITWVAILVFVAFFAGFWVRGIMNPSTSVSSTSPLGSSSVSNSSQSSGVCPVTGKTGPAGAISSTATATGSMGTPTGSNP